MTVSLAALLAACTNQVAQEPVHRGPLARAFADASAQTGVPEDLLKAVAWVETRWTTPDVDNDHVVYGRGERGMLGVVDRDDQPWLAQGARAAGVDLDAARTDPRANVRVAATVLRDLYRQLHGDALPSTIHGWRQVLALYGADGDPVMGDRYADAVFLVLETGARAVVEGETFEIAGSGAKVGGDSYKQGQALTADSSLVTEYVPARAGFFHAGRSATLDRVVIHTTEGSYDGAISWFRSPNNPYQTSAHYVIRSSDGEITQMVKESDTAYHVRSWNSRAIGIEHEAISSQSSWFTEAMYRSSAALVRDICLRNGIPMDRTHIVGHVEVPGNDHSDPGQYWDWDYYMSLVLNGDDAPPPSAGSVVQSSGFCATHGGTWCDGDDVVVCSGQQEVSRTACDAGCHHMPMGTPDECFPSPVQQDDPPPSTTTPDQGDPCGGETYEGRCDGTTLIYCLSGDVIEADCAQSGRVCGWQDDSVGNNCLNAPPPSTTTPEPESTDPCGGETYEGRCDGDTLIWCQAGYVRNVDCSVDGQMCGWQDDAIGNNCLSVDDAPPPPAEDPPQSTDSCNGETYQGRCDGDTLVWCDAGQVYSVDCSMDQQVCGWQDDTVGNNCL